MLAWGTGSMPTSPVLPIGKVGGDGDSPALPHARALQPPVHPWDDIALPHIGIVGAVSGVAAIHTRRGGGQESHSGPALPAAQSRPQPPPSSSGPPGPGVKEGTIHQGAVVVVTHEVPSHGSPDAARWQLQCLQLNRVLWVVDVNQ